MSLLRLGIWLLILALIFLPLERLVPLRRHKAFHGSLGSDVGYYFINGLVPGLLLAGPMSLVAWGAYHLVPYSVHAAVTSWPLWLRAIAALIISEIGFYWGHRWTHAIPFLWRFHSVHHSAEHVYFLVSARAHPFDNAFIKLCGLVPVYVIGIGNPLTPSGNLVPLLVVLFGTVWGFFIHSNLRWRLGPLEWVISTPGFHHWHHTKTDHRDRNFASMLPFVDLIFGSFHLPRRQWPSAYGIETSLPNTLVGQLIYPFRPGPVQIRPEPVQINPPVATESR